eukprot:TRINITY_DN4364_c0_g1_i1.p1 TRINITY_DN4364_c0_g1~~TRINITY_DN4364_c0_g1_i1.p1  ORF type:complete len:203 (+),score=58.44 TRINITY_DN4364_c0_g1_i1:52-660(+)
MAGLSDEVEAETEALLSVEPRRGRCDDEAEGKPGAPQHHYFAMSDREVRSLLRHQQAQLRREQEAELLEEERARQQAEVPMEEGGGKLVIDPCLGRLQLLRAKALLAMALLSGLIFAAWLAVLCHKWLEAHLDAGAVPTFEAVIIMGIVMPAALVGFLCVLEHCEWNYVRTVSPTTKMPYTPLLHELLPKLRRVLRRLRGQA